MPWFSFEWGTFLHKGCAAVAALPPDLRVSLSNPQSRAIASCMNVAHPVGQASQWLLGRVNRERVG